MVERPYALTLPQLRALPPVNQDETLTCISNPVGGGLIGNAHWKGVSLSSLLERAGVQAGAVDVKLTCADGYTESFPIAKAMEPEVVLAYEMNGAPLTDSHGAPARLLVPNIYGMKNTKWLEKIEIVGTDYQGYWQRQGWSDTAIIQLISQVRVPGKADKIQAGSAVKVGGIAFAAPEASQGRVGADAGTTWREARLGDRTQLMALLGGRLDARALQPRRAHRARHRRQGCSSDRRGKSHPPQRLDGLPPGPRQRHVAAAVQPDASRKAEVAVHAQG
ncbi:MAG: molybdopterin-dependent oxidoreductase [Chloroflexia bacterium]